MRHGLNKGLSISDADRVENIRRVWGGAALCVDAGLITLSAFRSPFRCEKRMIREMFQVVDFIGVYMSESLAVYESRDSKGPYQKARVGKVKNFTGIDSNYERPEKAEIVIDTSLLSVADSVDQIVNYFKLRDVLAS